MRTHTLVAAACSSRLPRQTGVSPPVWVTCPARTLRLCPPLCAGHNKWSKVKHIKGPKDEARSKIFHKLSLMIKVAVREGGPNPDFNLNLAQLLEQCRSKNMPKASVDAAIKSAEKAKPMSQHMIEVRGPGGYLLLVEVLTDNLSRTQQDVKRLLVKKGAVLSDGARHSFIRRGVVMVPNHDVTTERALELAIEAGAEDVQETEDEEDKPHLQFFCDMTELKKVRGVLEALGMQVTSAGVEFVPRTLSSLGEEQLDAASTLIDALSDSPDVVRVWDNIRADS